MFGLFLIGVLVAVWVVCGVATGAALGAERKGNALGGIMLAMFVGPFAVLFIDQVRDKQRRCPYCGCALTRTAEICPACGDWLPPRPRVVDVGPDVPFMDVKPIEREEGDYE